MKLPVSGTTKDSPALGYREWPGRSSCATWRIVITTPKIAIAPERSAAGRRATAAKGHPEGRVEDHRPARVERIEGREAVPSTRDHDALEHRREQHPIMSTPIPRPKLREFENGSRKSANPTIQLDR